MIVAGHDSAVATRRRPKDIGAARARELLSMVGRELYSTRSNAGLSQDVVSATAGMSRPKYGRIERANEPEVSVSSLARIAAALGLELSVRFYPAGDPVRDAGHVALLGRLAARCHPNLVIRTEVPFPRSGDGRAWDALITGFASAIRCAVEAETRPTDVQALTRKLALKERDGDAHRLILLLSDTRHNRAFLHGPGESLRRTFPLPGRRALELLAAGADPGGNAIVLL